MARTKCRRGHTVGAVGLAVIAGALGLVSAPSVTADQFDYVTDLDNNG